MKHLHFSILLAVLMSMAGAKAWAYDIEVENDQGIQLCYNYINDGKELEVERLDINLRNKEFYLIIPETVTYMNRTRKVTRIGNYAVRDFRYLYSVTIPNSVTSIGEGAFYSCYSLLKVIIPNSVINIEAKAFQQCYGLKSVIIGNSVTSIGKQAFELCEKLSEVTIPNSVTSIGIRAFNRCTGLTSVSIPNSVTSIGEETFLGCGLTSVTIPNSVSSIGERAFFHCSGLTSVTIPNSVTRIEHDAFLGCKKLLEIISLIEDPANCDCGSSTFEKDTKMNATLYVPKGTTEKYKEAIGWKDFVWIEEGVPSGIESTETKERRGAVRRYTLDGVETSSEKKGINIIKTKDGTTKKVLIK